MKKADVIPTHTFFRKDISGSYMVEQKTVSHRKPFADDLLRDTNWQLLPIDCPISVQI